MTSSAKIGKRLLALLIDYCLILVWGIILLILSLLVYFLFLKTIPTFTELSMNLISLTMILPVLLYSIITEASSGHATFGKQKMHLCVASVLDQPIHLWQIVARNIIKYFPWQFAHMMIFRGFAFNWALPAFWMVLLILSNMLPFIWIAFVLFRCDHRGIHDLVAKTIVVSISDLLK